MLLRDSILDGMRDLLLTRDWSSITLSDVAERGGHQPADHLQRVRLAAGPGRRATRCGWPTGSSTRSTSAINGNVGDIYAAFLEGFRDFFTESAADPLVISLLTGGTKPDLLQLITTDSGPIITHCSERLTSTFMHSWVRASEEDAGVLARAIVRLAMSYVSMPPEADHDVARDLATSDDAVRRTVRCHRIGLAAGLGACPASPQAKDVN